MNKFRVFLSVMMFASCMAIDTVVMIPSKCGVTEPRSPGKIIQAQPGVAMGISLYTPSFRSCVYTLQATTANHRIRFGFGTGNGEVNAILHDRGCGAANIQVFDTDGTTTLLPLTCGVFARTEYVSTGDRLILDSLSVGGNNTIFNFTAHYTSFLDTANCSQDASYFPCANGRCVDREGRCDVTRINNCGDFSDNSIGPPGNCSVETTTIAMTTQPGTMPVATQATGGSSPNLLWIAWVVLGILGAFLLYFLLWRPGYLTWRCAAWRHVAFCRNHGWCQKAPGSNPFSCCTDSKVTDSATQGAAQSEPVTSQPGNMTQQEANTNGVLSDIEEIPTGGGGQPMTGLPGGIQRESHIFGM